MIGDCARCRTIRTAIPGAGRMSLMFTPNLTEQHSTGQSTTHGEKAAERTRFYADRADDRHADHRRARVYCYPDLSSVAKVGEGGRAEGRPARDAAGH